MVESLKNSQAKKSLTKSKSKSKSPKTNNGPSRPKGAPMATSNARGNCLRKEKLPYVYCTDAKRAEALKLPSNCRDPLVAYLTINADKYFAHKMVYTNDDWLATVIESGQTA